MFLTIHRYKEKFHFSVNFFSIFLLVTFLPDIFPIDSSLVKNLFWGIKVILASWVIYRNRTAFLYLRPLETSFLIVSCIYLLNLLVDVFLDPLPFLRTEQGKLDFYGFFLGIIIALSFRYDPGFHSEKSFLFFWGSLTIGLIAAYFLAVENHILDPSNVRYDANSTVNSINYGIAGCTLSLVSLFGIVKNKRRALKVVFFLTFIVGLMSIAKAGSRSPIVVLVVMCSFYFVARLGFIKGLFIILASVGLTILSLEVIIQLLESMGSSLGIRLSRMIVEGETSGRTLIYKNVLGIIEGAPFFGSSYVLPSGVGAGSYPHNFILEVFMTTGLVGGIPFTVLLVISIFKCYKLLKIQHPSSWIVLIYLQVVGYGMFSTSLYSSQDFWSLLFFVLSITILSKSTTPKPRRLSASARRPLAVSH